MNRDTPVLIEAVVNGVASKESNPNVPRSHDEIRRDILACFAAGASVVHSHEAEGSSGPGDADSYAKTWGPVLEELPGAIVYPSLGSSGTTLERLGHLMDLADRGMLRVCAFDPGSTNLGVRDEAGVPLPTESVYANSYAFIAEGMEFCRRHRLAGTFAIFEPTFLHTIVAYQRGGRLPAGTWIKFYFGGAGGYTGSAPRDRLMPFGLPPTVRALEAYLEILGDCPIPWGVSAAGGDVVGCGIARAALERGGHVHVGLEMYEGGRQPTNVELVEEVVALCHDVGRPTMRWNEVPSVLGFPSRS